MNDLVLAVGVGVGIYALLTLMGVFSTHRRMLHHLERRRREEQYLKQMLETHRRNNR